jgi:hypothetical protein
MGTRLSLLVSLAACAAALLAAPAHASHAQITIFDASEELSGGLCCGPLTGSALDDARSEGADVVRVLVYWRDVVAAPDSTSKPPGDSGDPAWAGYAQPAPGDPGKGWGKYDLVVAGIAARGMRAMLVPTGRFPDGRVPRWASNARGKDGTDPDPAEYGSFLKALARRYPGAAYVGVWNEPNSPFQLAPQVKSAGPYTPGLYRRLFAAGRAGLLAAGFRGRILIGELAPRGTASTLGALAFTRQLLCLKRAKRGRLKATCPPLRADGFALHPHTGIDPPWRAPFAKNDVTIGNLGALSRLLRQAALAGAINRLPLLLTEYGVQTNPPDPTFGVSFSTQAEYLGIAEYLAWRNRGVAAWSQYLLRDDADVGGFQSGLRLRDGAAKPSFNAFRTPLVIRRSRRAPHRVSAWGEVRPTGSAHVQILRNAGKRWLPATPIFKTDRRGYFQRRLAYKRGRRFRLVWFDAQDGKPNACSGDCLGPPIRAYAFR